MMEIREELTDVETQCFSPSVGMSHAIPHPNPTSHKS